MKISVNHSLVNIFLAFFCFFSSASSKLSEIEIFCFFLRTHSKISEEASFLLSSLKISENVFLKSSFLLSVSSFL
jgi:hypothetical protein